MKTEKLMKMKESIKTNAIRLSCAVGTMQVAMMSQVAMAGGIGAAGGAAGGKATAIMQGIIEIIGGLILILGVIFAIMGVVHYAAANAEGDGPAKNKSVQQIASGIMLVALSATLIGMAGTIAGWIS